MLDIENTRSNRSLQDFLCVPSAKWDVTSAECLLGGGSAFVSIEASTLHRRPTASAPFQGLF